MEAEECVYQYALDKEKARLDAEEKRKKLMEMMKASMAVQNGKRQKEAETEIAESHLINQKDILLMSDYERIRKEQGRVQKRKDDGFNRTQ